MPNSLLHRSRHDVSERLPVAEHSRSLPVGLFASFACLALVLFVAIDFSVRLLPNDPFATPEKSSIWWAASAYENTKTDNRRPEICLLGSSLMIAAQDDTDATYFRKQFDAIKHYHSDYLEERLAGIAKRKITTSSFAIGGQMASDALTIFRVLLAEKDTGQIIVWGVAPRDFIDATFGGPRDTETVRFLSRFPTNGLSAQTAGQTSGQSSGQTSSQMSELSGLSGKDLPLAGKSFWTSVNDWLANLSATYAKRLQIRAIYQTWLEHALAFFQPSMNQLSCPDWLQHDAALLMPEDNRPGQWIVRPMEAKGNELRDNTHEYEKRYHPFNAKRFAEQLSYYRALLHEARAKNLRLLVVNMPLRKDNLALLPPGVYQKYRNAVSEIAKEEHQTFLDLNDNRFGNDDFWDPVHLNGYGGVRFMNCVVGALSEKHWL